MRPPLIPNVKMARPPAPGSVAEFEAIEAFGSNAMADALLKFGPDNMGAAIAALCVSLGTIYRMMPPIAAFYGSPDRFAAACQVMIGETAAAVDDADDDAVDDDGKAASD